VSLHAICYRSRATHPPSDAETNLLVAGSRERNARSGVTSVLLYGAGRFLQYLEGPRETLDVLYGRIVCDPLHTDVFELIRDPIPEREFAQWPLAFRDVERATLGSDRDRLKEILRSEGDCSKLGRLLLNAFWKQITDEPDHELAASHRRRQ
jgi:hypothetical protein